MTEMRCPECKLNQYVTERNRCRRCHMPLFKEKTEPKIELIERPNLEVLEDLSTLTLAYAKTVKAIRLSRHMSQRDVANAMHCPRTYLSKVENARTLPTL